MNARARSSWRVQVATSSQAMMAAFCGLVSVTGCDRAPDPLPQAQSPASSESASIPVTTIASAPKALDYFQAHCASCHGPYARFAGPQYAKALSDDALIRKVQEMAAGPSKAPLDPAGLAAQVAFHRSLQQGSPFVSLVSRDAAATSGEVSPGSAVVVFHGSEQHAAEVSGHIWRLKNGLGTIDRISATLNGRVTEIDLSRQSYSHDQPLP